MWKRKKKWNKTLKKLEIYRLKKKMEITTDISIAPPTPTPTAVSSIPTHDDDSAAITTTSVTDKIKESKESELKPILENIPDDIVNLISSYASPMGFYPNLSIVFPRLLSCDIISIISITIDPILEPVILLNNNNNDDCALTTKKTTTAIIRRRLKTLNHIGRRCILTENIDTLIMILFLHHMNYQYLPWSYSNLALWSELNHGLLGFANSSIHFPDEDTRQSKSTLYSKAKEFTSQLTSKAKNKNKQYLFAYQCGYRKFATWLHMSKGYEWESDKA